MLQTVGATTGEATTAERGGNSTLGAETARRGRRRGEEKIATAGEGVQRTTVHDGALIGVRDCGARDRGPREGLGRDLVASRSISPQRNIY